MATGPWSSLESRRFGGDAHVRTVAFQEGDEADATSVSVHVKGLGNGKFDIIVESSSGSTTFTSVPAHLASTNVLSVTLNSTALNTTIVSQHPAAGVPPSTAFNTMERLHVFHEGRKITLALPWPKYMLSLGGDVLSAAAKSGGVLKAPMPSLIVDVRVKVGDKIEKGQAVVVLESMKTETVLRASVSGVVKSVGCKNGEMVEEGKELVDIEPESTKAESDA
jgi:3-methylcrotonyl-CoA carboxylase alpha subunit